MSLNNAPDDAGVEIGGLANGETTHVDSTLDGSQSGSRIAVGFENIYCQPTLSVLHSCSYMANVFVSKTGTENTPSLMRRFTKRVQSAGLVRKVRGMRYFERTQSPTMRRKSALKLLEKRAHTEELAKQGKLVETKNKRHR